jgi:hypothetical protein
MNDQNEIERTAARLKDALGAAANVMVVRPAPEPQRVKREYPDVKRARGWLIPLAAAASVVVIAVGAVAVAHLASPAGTRPAGARGGSPVTPPPARPEYYLTATYPAAGPNVLQFQVRRTDGGAVTSSRTISGANVGWGGYITAAASDRDFYFAKYPCIQTAIPDTTFYRITITNSGQISGFAPVGRPVKGMVTTLAISPDGSAMAYTALEKACATGHGLTLPGAASVSVADLSTGRVRTWQDTAATPRTLASRLSWAPDGRTLVVNESTIGGQRGGPLTVYGLDPASSGGSLQAHSTTLLRQGANCSPCVTTALAGPDGSLTALQSPADGKPGGTRVVRIPSTAGHHQSVLYDGPLQYPVLFTDPSGQWVLLWPAQSRSRTAGWISGGRLHPLPGVGEVNPQGIAW